MAEFIYNNKMHSSTKTSLFKANYRQDLRMGFEGRKKGKYKGAEKFIEKNEGNTEGSESGAGKSIRRNKEVCQQKVKGGKQL